MTVVKVRSFDSMTRRASNQTLDTILTVATDAELAAYMTARAKMNPGLVWDGIFRPMLESMDKAARDEVMGEITSYGNEMATSKSIGETAASGLIFGGQNDENEVEGQKIVEGNEAGKTDITGHKVGDAMRKWRGHDHDRIADVQKANEAFWKR
jgi:hypothetical protein